MSDGPREEMIRWLKREETTTESPQVETFPVVGVKRPMDDGLRIGIVIGLLVVLGIVWYPTLFDREPAATTPAPTVSYEGFSAGENGSALVEHLNGFEGTSFHPAIKRSEADGAIARVFVTPRASDAQMEGVCRATSSLVFSKDNRGFTAVVVVTTDYSRKLMRTNISQPCSMK
jgi:hypothetical protein